MSTPVTTAPPLANRARSTTARKPTSRNAAAGVSVKRDEPQEMMEFFEMILIEIVEKAPVPTGCRLISRS